MSINSIRKNLETNSNNYLRNKSSNYKKTLSQYFTSFSVADLMTSAISYESFANRDSLKILEPSAGSGILLTSLLEKIATNCTANSIEVTAFELDDALCTILENTLEELRKYLYDNFSITLVFKINNSNFLLECGEFFNSNSDIEKFDIIISNPPFKKIQKSSPEYSHFDGLIKGQPNLYHLFTAMSLKLLAFGGLYVAVTPRNYLTGLYSETLRNFIFSNYKLDYIHSFNSRSTIFKEVLQEVIITIYSNPIDFQNDNVMISYNGSSTNFNVSFQDLLLDDDKFFVLLPKNPNQLSQLDLFKQFENSISDLGIQFSVGQIVGFRNKNYLKYDLPSESNCPYLISSDISLNQITYSLRTEKFKSYSLEKTTLLRPRANYLLLRRVTAKDDNIRLISAVLTPDVLPAEFYAFDNNLIYFQDIESNSLDLLYGLFVYFTSSYFSDIFDLISSTHAVNIYDLNLMRFPSRKFLESLGSSYLKSSDKHKDIHLLCNKLLKKAIAKLKL